MVAYIKKVSSFNICYIIILEYYFKYIIAILYPLLYPK